MFTFAGERQPQETIRIRRRLGLVHISRLSQPSFHVTPAYERNLYFLRTGGAPPVAAWLKNASGKDSDSVMRLPRARDRAHVSVARHA